jgi:hypothetical protein
MTWGKDEDGSIYVIPIQQADGNWIKHAEYARLKAEVERLTDAITRGASTPDAKAYDDHSELLRENAFLKSEVDRLKNNCEYIDRQLDEYINGKETE